MARRAKHWQSAMLAKSNSGAIAFWLQLVAVSGCRLASLFSIFLKNSNISDKHEGHSGTQIYLKYLAFDLSCENKENKIALARSVLLSKKTIF